MTLVVIEPPLSISLGCIDAVRHRFQSVVSTFRGSGPEGDRRMRSDAGLVHDSGPLARVASQWWREPRLQLPGPKSLQRGQRFPKPGVAGSIPAGGTSLLFGSA